MTELASSEKYLQSAVLGTREFRLRRWVLTDEGWDDDDNPCLQILNEGDSIESLNAEETTNVP